MAVHRAVPIVSSLLGTVSVLAAFWIRVHPKCPWHDAFAYGLVAAWTLVHPIWFSFEWSRFDPKTPAEFEHFKYSQKLAATIWVALIVVLSAIMGIKWGGGGP